MQKSVEGNEISYILSSDDMYYPPLAYDANKYHYEKYGFLLK